MHRRKIISVTISLSIGICGCMNANDSEVMDNDSNNDENDVSRSNNYSDLESCPTMGHLTIYSSDDKHNDAEIVDADKLSNRSKYFEKALVKANEKYKEMENNTDGKDQPPPKYSLITIGDEEMATEGIVEKEIGYAEDTYIKYDGEIYIINYIESAC